MEAEVQGHTPLARPHVWAQGRICPEDGTDFSSVHKGATQAKETSWESTPGRKGPGQAETPPL